MELVRTDNETKTKVMVEWVDLGEGISGDYDENDTDDVALLRFDVSVKHKGEDDWTGVEDASYCTQMPADDTDEKILKKGLEMIMDEVFEAVVEGHSIKKCCEQLSWISPESVNKGVWERKLVV